jgi:hypothetical protein
MCYAVKASTNTDAGTSQSRIITTASLVAGDFTDNQWVESDRLT